MSAWRPDLDRAMKKGLDWTGQHASCQLGVRTGTGPLAKAPNRTGPYDVRDYDYLFGTGGAYIKK